MLGSRSALLHSVFNTMKLLLDIDVFWIRLHTHVPEKNAIEQYKCIQVNETPSSSSWVLTHKDPFDGNRKFVFPVELSR